MSRSFRDVIRVAPLRPSQAGWAMVVGFWVAFVFLVGVGITLIVTGTRQSGGGGPIAGWLVGGIFIVLGLACLDPLLLGGKRFLKVTVDEWGLRAGNGMNPDEVVLGWNQIAGVGDARKISPKPGVKLTLARSLEVLTEADVEPDPLVAEWVEEEPPAEGLPSSRLRFASVNATSLDQIRTDILAVRPDKWLGELERGWDHRPGH